MSDGKTSRQALAEAVEELRAEVAALRAERAAHHCHPAPAHYCNWGHYGCWAYHTMPGCAPYQPLQVWYGTTVASGTNVCATDMTSVAAGGVSTYSLALGN